MLPLLRKIIGTTMVMAATYMLQMFDLIYITTKGGPGTATTNLPLMLYSVYKSENNYGYSNAIGVCIVIAGVVCMTLINKAMKVNRRRLLRRDLYATDIPKHAREGPPALPLQIPVHGPVRDRGAVPDPVGHPVLV